MKVQLVPWKFLVFVNHSNPTFPLLSLFSVCVSILTIAGNECRTMELGIVANETSGAVDSVDPLSLTQQFGSILANPIIATNVIATVLLHQKLYV